MQYFTKTQLATRYNVSESAVRHWIDSAHRGRIKLVLYEQGGKSYVANTTENTLIMQELAERGQRYKNSRYHRKTLRPSAKFYELYSPKQVLDIMSSLDVHREIPLQYSYFDTAADYWDKYAYKLLNEPAPNMLSSEIDLLNLSQEYINRLLGNCQKVNVIDLGPGNCLPVKDMLGRLLEKKLLGRYVGIDLSEEMLSVAQRNLASWFGDRVSFEGYARDITDERFDDLLINEHFGADAERTTNLVVFFGGTLTNLRAPAEALHTIRKSMGRNDLLLYTTKPDTPNSRQYFDFGVDEGSTNTLAARHRVILDLLNVDESCYEVEKFFDEAQRARFIRVRLTTDVSIQFELDQVQRPIDINKGETILVWRSWHQNAFDIQEQFNANGFSILQTSMTRDHEYLLMVAEIRTGADR